MSKASGQKCMKRLRTRSFCNRALFRLKNNYFLFVVALLAASATRYHPVWVLVLAGWLGYLLLADKTVGLVALIITGLFFLLVLALRVQTFATPHSVSGFVLAVKPKATGSQLTVLTRAGKFLVQTTEQIRPGAIITAQGESYLPAAPQLPSNFDYPEYLKKSGIRGLLRAETVTLRRQLLAPASLNFLLVRWAERTFPPEAACYIKALVFGDNSGFSPELKNAFQINSIVHLFAISGMHVALIIAVLDRGLSRLKLAHKDPALIALLAGYLVVTNFAYAVTRACLMYTFQVVNKKRGSNYSALDIASLVFLFMTFASLRGIYNLGFLLSFFVTFAFILTPNLQGKSKITTWIKLSLIAQLATLPLTAHINYELNLLSPLLNVLFITLVQFVLLPGSFLAVFIPPSGALLAPLARAFGTLALATSRVLRLPLNLYAPPYWLSLFYYPLIFAGYRFITRPALRRRLLLAVVVGLAGVRLVIPTGKVFSLALYDGEATVITQPHKLGAIVIDTGSGRGKELTKFLKSQGVQYLEAVFITHGHLDHYGELFDLQANFYIKKLYVSRFDRMPYARPPAVRLAPGDVVTALGLDFTVLAPQVRAADENDNSLVLHTRIGPLTWLFTGDASRQIERRLPPVTADVLKVGHHGSRTATDPEFIRRLAPQIAIIQTGDKRAAAFPHPETLRTLAQAGVRVYCTKETGLITYRYLRRKFSFRPFRAAPPRAVYR